jgi:hypothetical protein
MGKVFLRTPKNYDGVSKTTKEISQVLPQILQKLSKSVEQKADLIIAVWPELIGERLSPMTQAISFIEGVLTVKVKNSSLYSLLAQHEKPKLIQVLRTRFPSVIIRNIIFRLG